MISKLPWKVHSNCDHYVILNVDETTWDMAKEDYDYIVKACNLFPELVGALEDCWVQFAIEKFHDGKLVGRWNDGLSALETVEDILLRLDRTDENGLLKGENK